MNSTTVPFDRHFEKINLLFSLLFSKSIILNTIVRINGFECQDGIIEPIFFEQCLTDEMMLWMLREHKGMNFNGVSLNLMAIL
jgi:hypothetical protein